jgi:hypothetical protein
LRCGSPVPRRRPPLRTAVWALMRLMLVPRLVCRNDGDFVATETGETRVDVADHRGESTLDDFARPTRGPPLAPIRPPYALRA